MSYEEAMEVESLSDDARTLKAEMSLAAGVSEGERVARIDELDLEPVVFKLLHPEPGATKLTLSRADRAVALYRDFLKLSVLFPDAILVPTRLLDQVWHVHVLDTAKYRADCDYAFGRFVDHFPYAGLRGGADRRAWIADFARTRQLFYEQFGADIGRQAAASACGNHGDGSECCFGCVRSDERGARPRPRR